ncbi:MAG: GIY-YIG nuclease family protein [Candidatus Vogelbacteria bacterium]|nr:GIY-YIG nuclease family protein [Candidatus Vogelbacteria bacterium]
MPFVYMIKNSANKLYVGISENPEERVGFHNSRRGARFTKSKPDFKIVFLEEYSTLTEARQREIQIKKWRREKKENLINKYQKGLVTKLFEWRRVENV